MARRRPWERPIVLLAAGAAVGLATWLSPTVRETLLVAGLASGVGPIQHYSAQALADSPSNRSALALVAFVNLKYRPPIDGSDWSELLRNPSQAPDARLEGMVSWLVRFECLPRETGVSGLRALPDAERIAAARCAEEALRRYQAERQRDGKLAERGLLSLCQLSGHAFGTYYEPNQWNGYTWASLDDERWAIALPDLNGWAFETFGREWLEKKVGPALEAMASAAAIPEPQP